MKEMGIVREDFQPPADRIVGLALIAPVPGVRDTKN